MSETQECSVVQGLEQESGDPGLISPSPGALLRQAREAAGVHIAVLAGALKVPVGKLEALEADDCTVLPDTVFRRALASTVCRALKLDPAEVLALMPKGDASRLAVGAVGLNASFKDGSEKSGRSFVTAQATRPLGWAVAMLLLGAIALVFFPRGVEMSGSEVISPLPAPQVAETGASPSLTPAPLSAVDVTPPAAMVPEAGRASELSAGVDATVPKPAPAPAVTGLAASSAPGDVGQTVPVDTLAFRARGQSWVQVRDAKGAVIFQRTLASGESASASSSVLPLSVVVGRADATEVFVRGAPLDVAALARENVARFEVTE
ncbi:hypothetical protein B2J86_16595 [Acidovorax sp. SRB_14]|nr:hypothetical protein [Acidovorax sp. SRB_24]NMM82527.1 hypothetical protein [Acidovorax sp. SRB_14]NMM89446.1 hypothetical protein [Rhodococcus sp. SRB_17]